PEQQGRNAEEPFYIDNSQGTKPVLVKWEDCDRGFGVVQPGQKSRVRIDGVKPPIWPSHDETQFGQDWYKVPDFYRVTMSATGEASRIAPGMISSPECNYDSLVCLWPFTYQRAGGRKLEPEWSQDFSPWHWDWRYVDPLQPDRAKRCHP